MRFPTTRIDAVRHAGLLALPPALGPAVVPPLAAAYQASTDALGSQDLPLLFGLLLTKRLVLYTMAVGAVGLAAVRSGDAAPGLGTRVRDVTREMLLPSVQEDSALEREYAPLVQELDSSSGAQQAAGLPLLLGVLLVGSAAVASVLGPAAPTALQLDEFGTPLEDVQEALRTWMTLSNGFVAVLFCNAELQALLCAAAASGAQVADDEGGGPLEDGVAPPGPLSYAALLAALVAVSAAYGTFGTPQALAIPVQNGVNACIAVGVARVLQLPQLGAICAALVGLALYDAIGTAGGASAAVELACSAVQLTPSLLETAVPSGAGVFVPTVVLADDSMMESVARLRMGLADGVGSWQPGLLTVAVKGRVTDALGLGDVVFPAMLAGWACRFDARSNGPGGDGDEARGYLSAALRGYVLGCVLLEVAPVELTSAALVFLVPSMLASVVGHAALRGELRQAFFEDQEE
eukprot:588563-Prymnesium_polylepis.1